MMVSNEFISFLALSMIVAATGHDVSPICFYSEFAPCACKKSKTTAHVDSSDGRRLAIQYTEYSCSDQQDAKLATKLHNKEGLQCEQLIGHKSIYRSTEGESIEADITYNTGCELRCIKPNCGKKQRKVVQINKSPKNNLAEYCANIKASVSARKSVCKMLVNF